MTTQAEIERRYANVRAQAQEDGLDAVVVAGSEYTGFEGAVRYLSGFRLLHRYAYVVLPVEGEPSVVFPKEARWVGDHGEAWIEDKVFAEHPGQWIADRGFRKIGVYGLDYVMPVRDYRPLAEVAVPWDQGFDTARAVKSEEELASVEESFRLNEDGVRAALAAYEVGKTEAEVMGEAERVFASRGTWRTTMDMVLTGSRRRRRPRVQAPEPHAPDRAGRPAPLRPRDRRARRPLGRVLRPFCAGEPSRETLSALDAYHEYVEAARATMRAGATAHDVHMAVSKPFNDRGFMLGHVTGHSIGMTMIEFPRVGEGNEFELRENMVISMHPHAITHGRAGVPLHAGHVARHDGRRRAVLAGADQDLQAGGGVVNGLDFFVEAVPPSLAVQYGRKVEEAGFRTAWFPEIVFGDAFAPATATATGTSTLLLGTGVVGIWSRSPVTMALQAASVNELSGGRMLLGLGVQARNYVSDWHGRTYERPIRAVREYLTILRQALAGEAVTFEGEIFSVRGFQLQMPMPEQPVRLYLAAVGPQMIRLAGELADGVLGYCWSIPYVEQVVLPALREGVARAGRTLADIDVACGYPTVAAEDGSGIEDAKGQVLMFATAASSSPFYAESFAAAGYGDLVAEVRERVAAGDADGAVAAIPDEAVEAMTVSGAPDQIHARVAALRGAGVQTIGVNPSPPGVWYPLYQGHFPDGFPMREFSFPAYLGQMDDVLRLIGG